MDVRPAETDHDLDEVRRLFNSFLAWHRQRHSDDLDLIEAYFDDVVADALRNVTLAQMLDTPTPPPSARKTIAATLTA